MKTHFLHITIIHFEKGTEKTQSQTDEGPLQIFAQLQYQDQHTSSHIIIHQPPLLTSHLQVVMCTLGLIRRK